MTQPASNFGPPLTSVTTWISVLLVTAGTAIIVAGMRGVFSPSVEWPGFVVAAPVGLLLLAARLVQVALAGSRGVLRDDPTKPLVAAGGAFIFTVLVATGIFAEPILAVAAGLFTGAAAVLTAFNMGTLTRLDPRIRATGPAPVRREEKKNPAGGNKARGRGLKKRGGKNSGRDKR